MNRTHRVFRSLPKLVLTAVALGIGTNEALAVGGGGHGGGGHGGGAGHVGAFHGGYGHGYGYGHGRGYWGGGYWGGYWGPYGYWGYPYGFGLGIGVGYGYGYGSGYGGYNYLGYPYYGSGYGYPYYGSPASIYGAPSPAAVDPYYGHVFPYGVVGSSTTSAPSSSLSVLPGAGPAPAPGGVQGPPVASADTEVTLIVRVPANAKVWVNGVKTTQNGTRREFTSSGLTPGRSYTFLVRAQWGESDGNAVDNDRRITVQAGERRAIDFGAAVPAVAVPAIANP
ncbi:TIGR03000 domain-containing protein [Frigoriglobus tundricola]|uniref:TIGR03000 domain-containing protein n=1 Tax=Frigoriglobus tundricola TaxID=2774151 RepID=A0A6M5YZF4_9BACT|nr:TIGR03000 domain-containing protein [Frigoriglobus tundricola]QJW99429.1 hypothetical protein FTUN_7041 [Frigoriglobus tundricola]